MEAGNKLKEMLVLGASRPWKEAMEVMTGKPKMDTDAIREYFAPLELWLRVENKRNGVTVGWEHSDDEVMCKSSIKYTRISNGGHQAIFSNSVFLFLGSTFLFVKNL